MTDLVLHHAVPSRSMTVHWLMEELGEPYDIVWHDIEQKTHKTPEYLAINPMGRVPALVHGGHVVTETAAICAYLADAFPKAGLNVPFDSPLRGDYYRWLFFAPVSMEPSILWRSMDLKVDGDYQPFAAVEEIAETLQGALTGREFIVGDYFTAADVMVGASVMWATKLMPVMPPLPEVVEYWDRLSERPAWKRAHEIDQEYLAKKA